MISSATVSLIDILALSFFVTNKSLVKFSDVGLLVLDVFDNALKTLSSVCARY